ncbi:hypothetical protein DXG01_006253 [Tephrocybe rancida]|nr:hypothetical protein DXG01_006253 [Tephrocybe rancida]
MPQLPNEPKTKEIKQGIPPTLRAHLLMLGVCFHTYASNAAVVGTGLGVLHALMDTGVLDPTNKNKDRWDFPSALPPNAMLWGEGVFVRAGLELALLANVGKGRGKDDDALARIKADLYCELISIETQRSSFPPSLSTLHTLISLLGSCTPSLWESYAVRVTLLWAQARVC